MLAPNILVTSHLMYFLQSPGWEKLPEGVTEMPFQQVYCLVYHGEKSLSDNNESLSAHIYYLLGEGSFKSSYTGFLRSCPLKAGGMRHSHEWPRSIHGCLLCGDATFERYI